MYLNNKELYVEIVVSKAQGKLTNKAKGMLEILAKKTIKKMRYYNEDDRKDCFQTGLLDLYSNWYNFNDEKSNNAFAYFTEVFKRGLVRGFNDIYKRKGQTDNNYIKMISIEGSNDGNGMYNI